MSNAFSALHIHFVTNSVSQQCFKITRFKYNITNVLFVQDKILQ